ncbi:MAG: cyclic nucleotide-binding domain-containing protein [Trueperaceae bacterium]|nr:cyclic nucleotide-binding domain-containing protein [Trueperaceae bacterium]
MSGAVRLLSMVGVRPSEGRLVGRLFALYFVLISALVLIQSMAFGLFIANYGAGRLPFAYLTIAVVGSLVTFAYLWIGARVTFGRLLGVNLGFLALGSFTLWVLLGTRGAPWVVFLLPVWFQIFVTLANLVVWPLALRLFDVRQSKRVFGIIGAGTWVANVLGGLVVAPLVAFTGPANLLLLAALIVVPAWFLLRAILREYVVEGATSSADGPGRARAARAPLGSYAWRIFAFVAAWWLAFYFVDAIFFAHAARAFADATTLTAFIGRFLSVTGAVALVTTVFLTGRILGRFGLAAGLLTMPVLVTTLIASVAVLGVGGASAAVLFWLAAASKSGNVALGFSLSQTANTVMYQALPGAQRERVQTLTEGIVQPLAIGAAGAILLVLTTLGGLDGDALAWVFLPLAALWLVGGVRVARAFPSTLAQLLARRRWGRDGGVFVDATSRELLRAHLRGSHPGAVIYAFERLAEDPGAVGSPDVAALLGHEAPEVRAAALSWIEANAAPAWAEIVRAALERERDPALRASALRALGASGVPGAVSVLTAALTDPAPIVRAGAVVGLIRSRDTAAAPLARRTFDALVAASDPSARAAAARALAALGNAIDAGSHLELLGDPDRSVRVEALSALTPTSERRLWFAVVQGLGGRRGSAGMARVLARGGEAALDAIEEELSRAEPAGDRLVVLAAACAGIGGPRAASLLVRLAEVPIADVQVAALTALARAGASLDTRDVRARLPVCRLRMLALQTLRAMVLPTQRTPLLVSALERAWRREGEILLLLLAHAVIARGGDATGVLDARAPLLGGDGHRTAQALEVIDSLIPADLRRTVLPWLETAPWTEASPTIDAPDEIGIGARLAALVQGEDARWHGPWMRACAIHAMGALELVTHARIVVAAEGDDDPIVAEAARWSADRLLDRPTADVHQERTPAMLSTLERVLVLKTADIFAGTPDDVLADVASVVEEVDLNEGAVVFRRGDVGDSLYVVVDGCVEVVDGERVIDVVGEREVFGEMALLDPEPRAASVRAVEPTRLLRLDRGPFIEILHDRPEVAIAILRVLTRRLRSRVRDLAALSDRLTGETEHP